MDVIVKKCTLSGTVSAPVSKSLAHRILICASLSNAPCKVYCQGTNEDIAATISCLTALGADIEYKSGAFYINPIKKVNKGCILDCSESGSTLRFILPLAAALGADASFIGKGRLPSRPLSPLYELMCENGVKMSEKGVMPLKCEGTLTGNYFKIDGGVSSQFITGLLLAYPIMGGATIEITGKCESSPYIDITLSCLKMFGIDVKRVQNVIKVNGKYISPGILTVEGDWSSAAFWLTAGVLAKKGEIRVLSLSKDSLQGDMAVLSCLKRLGGRVEFDNDCYIAYPSMLSGCTIDCSDFPDLVPILSVAAAFARGDTVFCNISRLRTKESDRVEAICALLSAFGISANATENTLTVHGGGPMGNFVDSFSDHRIAMSGAILAASCGCECTIKGAECVKKSYPNFFDDLNSLSHFLQ